MVAGNLLVDISDGHGFFSGTLEDLSKQGLKIDDVPKKLDEKAKQLSLVVSGKGKHFKMNAQLRWALGKTFSKEVGLEIIQAPPGWEEFVMDFKPEDNNMSDIRFL